MQRVQSCTTCFATAGSQKIKMTLVIKVALTKGKLQSGIWAWGTKEFEAAKASWPICKGWQEVRWHKHAFRLFIVLLNPFVLISCSPHPMVWVLEAAEKQGVENSGHVQITFPLQHPYFPRNTEAGVHATPYSLLPIRVFPHPLGKS